MIERRALVIDASVVARWYLKNPPYLAETLQVRSDRDSGRIGLVAPNNLRYEVSGAIHRAVTARYLRASEGETLVAHLLNDDIAIIDSDGLILRAFRLSIRFGCSFYDAVYLAVAEAVNHSFLHADASLHRVLASRFPLELWIEDYNASVSVQRL